MRAVNVLLAILMSAAIGLAVLEGGLRLIPAYRAKPTLNQYDPLTGWSQVPGKRIVRHVGGEKLEFQINALGLRDDADLKVEKPAGTRRVLMLGDSFTLGYTVAREHAFADLLERRWQAEGRPIEVVNAGTEAWSTDQQVAWFLERGAAYAPDVVLLFPFENDIYWNGQERYGRFPKPRFTPAGELEPRELVDPGPLSPIASSAIVRFLQTSLGALLSRPTERTHHQVALERQGQSGWILKEFTPLLNDPPAYVEDSVQRTEGALIALKARCDALGARLAIVPIPSKSAIDPEEREFFRGWSKGLAGLPDSAWSPDRPVDLFLALAAKHGIDAIDPRAELRAATTAGQKLYFDKQLEWHFNAAGNHAFAAVVHDGLDRLGELGAPPDASHAVPADRFAQAPRTSRPLWPFVFGGLWLALSALYIGTYPDERKHLAALKVGGLLALVFTIILGGRWALGLLPAHVSGWLFGGFVVAVLGFVAWKLGRRIGTVAELLRAFVLRGHWYLMPLIVVLLTVGSLLVVAASSPLVAPFIYTLF
jgi:lysophospholipase L1-like esterase